MAPRDETPESGEASGSEANEGPVHYQISITGRQAGTFFFALLVALGLAFFFGMKTGAAARRGLDPMTRGAASDGASLSSLPPEDKGDKGEAAGSLRTKNSPSSSPGAEVGEKKLGFDDGPPATPRPESTSTPARAVPPASPAPEPTRAVKPKPTASVAVEKGPKPAKRTGPFFVQILATRNEKTADELVKKLKNQGFSADVSTAPKHSDLFRVRVGPYGDHAKAEGAMARIKKANPALKNPVVAP